MKDEQSEMGIVRKSPLPDGEAVAWREAEKLGFRLWQERAPHGEWFIATPHDDHLCFGSDIVGARQCLSAISRLCGELNAARTQLVKARADLQEYGQHTVHCDHDRPSDPKCTCGFSEALALTDDQGTRDADSTG